MLEMPQRSEDGRPDWNEVAQIAEKLFRAPPASIPLDQLAAIVDYAFDLLVDLTGDQPPRVAAGRVVEYERLGFSRAATSRLIGSQQLDLLADALCRVLRLAHHTHEAAGTTPTLSRQFEFFQLDARLLDYLADAGVSTHRRFTVVESFVSALIATNALFRMESLVWKRPDALTPSQAADLLALAGSAIHRLMRQPLLALTVPSDTINVLIGLVPLVQDAYAPFVRAKLKHASKRIVAVVDPSVLVSVAAIDVFHAAFVTRNVEMLSDTLRQYDTVLSSYRNMPEAILLGSGSVLTDCVVPGTDFDRWPRSLPEIEELVRFGFLASGMDADPKSLHEECWAVLQVADSDIAIRIPRSEYLRLGGSVVYPAMSKTLSRAGIFGWLVFNSEVADRRIGGFFSGWRGFVKCVEKAVEEERAESRSVRLQAILREAALTGVASATFTPAVIALFPRIPSGVAEFVSASLGYALVEIAKKVYGEQPTA